MFLFVYFFILSLVSYSAPLHTQRKNTITYTTNTLPLIVNYTYNYAAVHSQPAKSWHFFVSFLYFNFWFENVNNCQYYTYRMCDTQKSNCTMLERWIERKKNSKRYWWMYSVSKYKKKMTLWREGNLLLDYYNCNMYVYII